MNPFIIEGKEPIIENSTKNNEEEKYIFEGNVDECSGLLEFTVELRTDDSMKICIISNEK